MWACQSIQKTWTQIEEEKLHVAVTDLWSSEEACRGLWPWLSTPEWCPLWRQQGQRSSSLPQFHCLRPNMENFLQRNYNSKVWFTKMLPKSKKQTFTVHIMAYSLDHLWFCSYKFKVKEKKNFLASQSSELNWPVGDERVLPFISVGGCQCQQQLPFLCVFQQNAADVAAGAELRSVVIDIDDFHSDGGDVLVHR